MKAILTYHSIDDSGSPVSVSVQAFAAHLKWLASGRVRVLPLTALAEHQAVTDHVGKTNAWGGREQPGIPTLPLLDWPDLERLAGRGASVEAHTRTHCRLHQLSADAIDGELQGCRDALRERLGVSSAHVAYPYGDLNDVVIERASRVFRFGHTTDFRVMRDDEAPMRLPRLDMYYFQRPGSLEAWGSPAFQPRVTSIRMRRLIRAWARI